MSKPKSVFVELSIEKRVGAAVGPRDAPRPVADFSTIHTPPSNTGVNHGVSYGGKRKASPKASKTFGDIPREKSLGRFVEATPATDFELRSKVLDAVKAFDLTADYLDCFLLLAVSRKERSQSLLFAQGLQTLSVLRGAIASALIADGVAVPSAPVCLLTPCVGGLQ